MRPIQENTTRIMSLCEQRMGSEDIKKGKAEADVNARVMFVGCATDLGVSAKEICKAFNMRYCDMEFWLETYRVRMRNSSIVRQHSHVIQTDYLAVSEAELA